MPSDIADQSRSPLHVERSVALAASADAVWAVVGDLTDTTITEGLAERVIVEGSGAGAVRRFFLPGGIERLDPFGDADPAGRSYAYRIFDYGPLPFTDYLGRAVVIPDGPYTARLSWSATATPLDGADDGARTMIDANIHHALSALARHFGTAEPR
jgi:hypothetical protein